MKNLFYLSVASVLFFTGCGGGGACCEQSIERPLGQSKVVGTVDNPNITPIARITNLPQTTDDCSSADASGENSSDEDGNITAYSWSVNNEIVSTGSSVENILPCRDSKSAYNVCLIVTDDKDATGFTCQKVTIVNPEPINPEPINPEPIEPEPINPEPIEPLTHPIPIIQLPDPYRDGDDFIFDACGIQDFSPHVAKEQTSDALTSGYLWQVTRYFEDNTTRAHQFFSCKKYIDWSSDANKFVKIDVSLTVRFTDGHENTTTSNYFPNEDASDLNITE